MLPHFPSYSLGFPKNRRVPVCVIQPPLCWCRCRREEAQSSGLGKRHVITKPKARMTSNTQGPQLCQTLILTCFPHLLPLLIYSTGLAQTPECAQGWGGGVGGLCPCPGKPPCLRRRMHVDRPVMGISKLQRWEGEGVLQPRLGGRGVMLGEVSQSLRGIGEWSQGQGQGNRAIQVH